MRQQILETVNSSQGIKEIELSLKVMEKIGVMKFSTEEYVKELEKLVKEGEIIEIEYELPEMAYRTKSFFLPSKTVIVVRAT